MSGDNQGDAVSINKEIEASAESVTPDILNKIEKEVVAISAPLQVDDSENIPSTSDIIAENPSIGELDAFDDDIEAVIEKKLKPVEDKALDIDSELDFELKWDDDTDVNSNDDLPKMETDSVAIESIPEPSVAIITLEQDMVDTTEAIEVQGEDIALSDVIDEKIDEDVNLQPNEDELLADEPVSNEELAKMETDTVILEPDQVLTTSEVTAATIEMNDNLDDIVDNEIITDDVDLQKTEDEQLGDEIPEMDNVHKVNLAVVSPIDSENNSLDERLVYSDVEAPEIEDKDLMNELDAQISETAHDVNIAVLEEVPSAIVLPKSDNTLPEIAAMDVDDSTAVAEITKSSLDDTLSLSLETSVYEVNNDHELAKPDAMIEIPTQEFIEPLDDSGEISDGVDQYDEELLLACDTTDVPAVITEEIKVTEVIEENIEEAQSVNIEPVIEEPDSETVVDTNKDEATSCEKEVSFDVNDEILTKDVEVEDSIITTPKANDKPLAEDTEDATNITSPKDLNVTTPKANDKPLAEDIKDATNITSPKDLNEPTIEISKNTEDNCKVAEQTETDEDKAESKGETLNIDNHGDVILDAEHLEPEKDTIAKDDNTSADIELRLGSEEDETNLEGNLESKATAEAKDIPSPTGLETKDVSETKTSSMDNDIPSPTGLEAKETSETKVSATDDAQPSTSQLTHQDFSDEDQEVTDSLGLLAESSRVMDEDDDNEQEEEDDDDDFDQDDESNQMGAEHSEDSNAPESHQITAENSEDSNAPECIQISAEQSEDSNAEPHHGILIQTTQTVETLDAEDSSDAEKAVVEGELDATELEEEVDKQAQAEESLANENEAEKAVEALLEADKSPQELTESVSEEDPTVENDSTPATEEISTSKPGPACSKLRHLLTSEKSSKKPVVEKESPTKVKKLEVVKPGNEINIVELEESSSEDDIQEVNKKAAEPTKSPVSESEAPEPKLPTPEKSSEDKEPSRGTVKSPEKEPAPAQKSKTSKFGLEIFNLDSDDDEKESTETLRKELTAIEIEKEREANKCINIFCKSDASVPLQPADASTAAFYAASQRRGLVCAACVEAALTRTQSLIEGIKAFTPLLSLHLSQTREDLVEISDSDSEEEVGTVKDSEKVIGKAGAKFLEEHLATMLNETWTKYDMDTRLQTAQEEIEVDVLKLEEECTAINEMLNDCQVRTDKLRNDLYDTFNGERKELPAIVIYDTPPNIWSGLEEGIMAYEHKETRSKRRAATNVEPPAKRPAIPLGYTPLESEANTAQNEPKAAAPTTDAQNEDDNADISVVKLSAENAPASLPPPGVATRPPLRANMMVYAMRNAFGSWMRARILEVQPRTGQGFTMCRVKFEHKVRNACKLLPARCLAYEQPSEVRMTIGTRIIALFKDTVNAKRESFYSGIVAEIPNPVNNYRYLVFFDDGYAQYVTHGATRLVCEFAPLVWDEVHPFSRQFVRDYLRAYPERPMVRAHKGQSLKTEWNGKWWVTRVLQVDASLVQVRFEDDERTEWIYRGSTRLAPLFLELQAAGRQRARPLPRAQPGRRFNMPYVEYTRTEPEPGPTPVQTAAQTAAQIEQDIRRQRAVAKKSTAQSQPPTAHSALDGVTSRVVFYTPKNAIKPHKMVPHTCSPKCRRADVLGLKELRTYNPLTKPLLSGWERQLVKYRFTKTIMYRAPCGRRIKDMKELHTYLRAINSDMGVDLFDFGVSTHCLAEFVLNKCIISKKDLSHGKENVPVPCVNYYDDSLPEFCSYNTERTPTAGVPLNLDPEFLCGCDCVDDCQDKSKCACWKMTLEGARTIGLDSDVGYVYKRLPEPLPSGIYECNSRCKCKQTCLNRVAQHPLQLKLQVFKTLNRGWGIRALNDVPKGSFLCVYAGNLLTDATANLDGLNEGDEYLAELDYIEVVEQMKEGFEEDIPDADKEIGKKDGDQEESSSSSSSEEEQSPQKDEDDDDFRPVLPLSQSAPNEFRKRLRKREKKSNKKEEAEAEKPKDDEDGFITISDDEEVREPARFSARAEMGGNEFVSKYKSVRAHFGKDEACYIMDAKVQGNIGRYLNHSCTPNVFVQNVFVDTHDPRFPWVAFFALTHIRAGTELTWNYNYDVGSVPGKVLYCHCAAPNCRGRLL